MKFKNKHEQLTHGEQRFYSVLKVLTAEKNNSLVKLEHVYFEFYGRPMTNPKRDKVALSQMIRRVRNKLGERSILTRWGKGIKVNEILE